MRRWLKLGKIPESCSQDEDFAEGPAMCITHRSNSHDGSSKMIVGGALGFDGKPVRIKVELPANLQRILKSDRKKNKRKRAARKSGKRGSDEAMEVTGQTSGGNFDENEDIMNSNSSDDEGDDILDMPDSFKKYILKKAMRQRNSSKPSRYMSVSSGLSSKNEEERALGVTRSSKMSARRLNRSNLSIDWSVSDFTTSSLSSLGSKVDSEEFLKYLEYGDSSDEFISDEYSLNSQLDTVEGENVSKPVKKHKSSKAVLTDGRPASFDSSMKRLCSSGNRTHSSLIKAQSKVLNDEGLDMRRSRSFPDPNSLHSSSTHLPPIKGNRSSQSYSRQSIRRLPQGKLSNNTQLPTKTGDEAIGFSLVQGRSFNSMVPKINSFVDEHGSDSSGQKEEASLSKNRTKGAHNTESVARDKERRQSQDESMPQNVNEGELHLPNIFDGSPAVNRTVNSTTATGTKHSTDRVQDSGQHERLPSQASQSVHLPRLRVDKGSVNGGEISRPQSTSADKFWQKIDGNHPSTSSVSVPVPATLTNPQGNQSHTVAMDTNMYESHAQSMLNGNMSQSTMSTNTVSSAVGSRRASTQTPTFPTKVNKKRQTSKVSQAIVREDVEFPPGRSNKNRVRPPPRQRAKQSKDMPLLQKLSENNLNKTLSAQLPEKPDLSRRQSIEMKSFNADDNIPRRIGHKLVKKKKGEDGLRETTKHNSKDINNIGDGTDATNSNVNANGLNPMSRRPSAFLSIEEDSNMFSQSPLSSSLKANQDLSTNFGYNSVATVASGVGGKSRPMSGGMGSKMSSNYPPKALELLQENKNSASPMLPPVRLKPLDPSQIVNIDVTTTNGLQPPSVLGVQEQMEDGEKGALGITNPTSAVDGQKVEGEEGEDGLEAIMEESEPESDDDDEYLDIRPIPDLKPVSTLSFSSNVFSYFPMGRAHKQAYKAVHQKAVAPAPTKKWGRAHRTPAKIAKRRKR